jgi:hypothetical protein
VRLAPFFKVYSEYYNNYDNAMELFATKLKKVRTPNSPVPNCVEIVCRFFRNLWCKKRNCWARPSSTPYSARTKSSENSLIIRKLAG